MLIIFCIETAIFCTEKNIHFKINKIRYYFPWLQRKMFFQSANFYERKSLDCIKLRRSFYILDLFCINVTKTLYHN